MRETAETSDESTEKDLRPTKDKGSPSPSLNKSWQHLLKFIYVFMHDITAFPFPVNQESDSRFD